MREVQDLNEIWIDSVSRSIFIHSSGFYIPIISSSSIHLVQHRFNLDYFLFLNNRQLRTRCALALGFLNDILQSVFDRPILLTFLREEFADVSVIGALNWDSNLVVELQSS